MNPISSRVLNEDECVSLLAACTRGRVGVTTRALPAILPVNYRYHDARLYIPVTANSMLARSAAGHVVAFQIDDAATEIDAGWSVLAIGRTVDVTRLATHDPVVAAVARSWTGSDPTLVLRLDPISISGRRVEWEPE
jgi:nitroimidazol reductase NimA-like FMN-containing flavoprotein (pyridoxamine 5'-phosphate oxidase superfamily)